MKHKKHVLILGGSSDIGIEVIKFFLKLGWKVTAHYNKNKNKLDEINKKTKRLADIQADTQSATDTGTKQSNATNVAQQKKLQNAQKALNRIKLVETIKEQGVPQQLTPEDEKLKRDIKRWNKRKRARRGK